jgi:hypothetical protein
MIIILALRPGSESAPVLVTLPPPASNLLHPPTHHTSYPYTHTLTLFTNSYLRLLSESVAATLLVGPDTTSRSERRPDPPPPPIWGWAGAGASNWRGHNLSGSGRRPVRMRRKEVTRDSDMAIMIIRVT